MRKKLSLLTRLTDERLGALVGELEAKIADIKRVEELRRANERQDESAQDWRDVADAIDLLIGTLNRVPGRIVENLRPYGLSVSALTSCREVASTAAGAVRKPVKRGRPAGTNAYRDGLARGAARIVRAHCPDISKDRLRHTVAAVLVTAGYSFMDPGKNPDKFDLLMQPLDSKHIAGARQCKEFEEKWGDHPL